MAILFISLLSSSSYSKLNTQEANQPVKKSNYQTTSGQTQSIITEEKNTNTEHNFQLPGTFSKKQSEVIAPDETNIDEEALKTEYKKLVDLVMKTENPFYDSESKKEIIDEINMSKDSIELKIIQIKRLLP